MLTTKNTTGQTFHFPPHNRTTTSAQMQPTSPNGLRFAWRKRDPGYAQPAQADAHPPKRRTLVLARAALECAELATASMPPDARGACCDISRAAPVQGAAGFPGRLLSLTHCSFDEGYVCQLAQLHQTIAEGSRRFHVSIRWQSQAHVSLANAVRRLRIPYLDKLTDPVLREASAHNLLPVRYLQRRSQALLQFLRCRAMTDAAAGIRTVDHMGPAQQCGTHDLAVMHERRANVRALHGGPVWAVADSQVPRASTQAPLAWSPKRHAQRRTGRRRTSTSLGTSIALSPRT